MSRVAQAHMVPAMLALILFTVILTAVDTVSNWISHQTSAVSWGEVAVETPTVRPGTVLAMTYTVHINKQCPAELRGFLVAPDGSVPVRFPVVAGDYTKPADGPSRIRVAIVIPDQPDPGLAPFVQGRYVYRTIATRYCADGVEQDTSIPDVPFQMEMPG